jgi:hypothetical protein
LDFGNLNFICHLDFVIWIFIFMQWKIPKNTREFYWTDHVVFKMRYYGLSVQKVLGVIKRPERKEEGIVKNTIAVMQSVNPKILNGKKMWKQEVWVMYQTKVESPKSKVQSQIANYKPKTKNYPPRLAETRRREAGKLKIISAWRYPGVSPQKNPIPSDILAEIEEVI